MATPVGMKNVNQHILRRESSEINKLDSLDRSEKLVVIKILNEYHGQLLYSDDHDGSAHCLCITAKIIRKIHGDKEPCKQASQ